MNRTGSRGIVTELGIALLLNLIAGIITYFFTAQLVYALLVVIILETIVIGIIYLQLIRRPKLVGIIGSAPTFDQGVSMLAVAQSVTTEFAFLGISAKVILSNDEFRAIMIKKAKGNCEFRFLLLDPNSPFLARKALEEGDTVPGWKGEIEANIERLKQLRDVHQLNIEVRLYDQFPIFRLMFVNGSLMYFGWYPIGLQGIRAPLLIVENAQHSLYEPLRMSFNELWAKARNPY